MTNKLPVVGKRYKNINGKSIWICINVRIERTPNGERWAILEQETGELGQEFDLKRDFWDYFEELPEDNAKSDKSTFK